MATLDQWVASYLAEELEAQCSKETCLFSLPLIGIINNPLVQYSSQLTRAKECVAALKVYAALTLKKFDNLMYLEKLSKKSNYDGKLEELSVKFIHVLNTGSPEFHQYLAIFQNAIEYKVTALTPSETKNAVICCLVQHHFKIKIEIIKCKVYCKASGEMAIENAAFSTLLDNITGWLTMVDKNPADNINAVIDSIIKNIYELKHRFPGTKMPFYLMRLEEGILCQRQKLKILNSPAKLEQKLDQVKAALVTPEKLIAATPATIAGSPVPPVVFKPVVSGAAQNLKASNSSLSGASQSSTSTDSPDPDPNGRSTVGQTADCSVGSSFCSESDSMSSLPIYKGSTTFVN